MRCIEDDSSATSVTGSGASLLVSLSIGSGVVSTASDVSPAVSSTGSSPKGGMKAFVVPF